MLGPQPGLRKEESGCEAIKILFFFLSYLNSQDGNTEQVSLSALRNEL